MNNITLVCELTNEPCKFKDIQSVNCESCWEESFKSFESKLERIKACCISANSSDDKIKDILKIISEEKY